MARINKNNVMNKLRMLGTSLVASNVLSGQAQEVKEQPVPEKKISVLQTPNKELNYTVSDLETGDNSSNITSKTNKFKDIKQLPAGLFTQKVEYVMSLADWRKDSLVNIKRANTDQIYKYELTSVMEAREGKAGDAVNLNKNHTRMFIFQSNPDIGKDLIRYMYCSNNKTLHQFAAKYIGNSDQNKALLAKVQKDLYDENGELKTGAGANLQRQKALYDMRKITTKGINANKSNIYLPQFIADFKKLAQTNGDEVLNAEKEFSVGFFPLYNLKRNVLAHKAKEHSQKNNQRDASCTPLGHSGLYLSSSIAFGCNSNNVLKETKVLNKAKKINECDYITLEAARQMALSGIDGADDMYKKFKSAIEEDKMKVQEYVNKMTTPDLTQKQDAIKNNHEELLKQQQTEKQHSKKTFDLMNFLNKQKELDK